MSQVRVHNFSISLDGFGTGDGLTLDAPFGHAGQRLHEWMFATRFWRSMVGEPGGTVGCRRLVRRTPRHRLRCRDHGPGQVRRRRPARGPMSAPTTSGAAGGGRTRRSTRRCSCSRTTRARRSRWRAAPCSTSSTPDPQEALDLAREAAGDLDVRIGGGPTVVRDFLAADLIDMLHVVQVPILLGRGVRLWDGVEGIEERYDIEAVSSPSGVTHLTFTRR